MDFVSISSSFSAIATSIMNEDVWLQQEERSGD